MKRHLHKEIKRNKVQNKERVSMKETKTANQKMKQRKAYKERTIKNWDN